MKTGHVYPNKLRCFHILLEKRTAGNSLCIHDKHWNICKFTCRRTYGHTSFDAHYSKKYHDKHWFKGILVLIMDLKNQQQKKFLLLYWKWAHNSLHVSFMGNFCGRRPTWFFSYSFLYLRILCFLLSYLAQPENKYNTAEKVLLRHSISWLVIN